MTRIQIEDVSPTIAGRRYPAKAVVGEHVPIEATVWCDGHDTLGAVVVWSGPEGGRRETPMSLANEGLDRWAATIVPDRDGWWAFRVDAWSDPWSTWLRRIEVKLAAGDPDLGNDLAGGADLLDRAASGRPPHQRQPMMAAARRLRDPSLRIADRLGPARAEPVAGLMARHPLRASLARGQTCRLRVDRRRALYGSWYEMFPRSTGGWDPAGRPVHGTLATATAALDRVADMGFDVVYLPPIHPIGRVNRKGRDNSVTAEPDAVGSPWAIGSDEGGHDEIHPALGTLVDFKAFVDRAHELDMEVAIDLALQCAPDHPWVREHPQWFTVRPDGTVAYAENPPKKYQDVYPLNFDNDPEGLFAEVLAVVLHWVEHGVRIFRVDNPHTKPPDFWHRLIRRVKQNHPDVLFLSEAFTRPSRLYGLARLGFDQNYTYFTWRTSKWELTEFGHELLAHAAESRPNLFVNTPDILPVGLHSGVPAAFAVRAALAATLGPSWGVYSGFELYEHEPRVPGAEEYLHSEKYELRPRDFAGALRDGRSLEPWLRRLNGIRRLHPALQQLRTLHFHTIDNDALIAYSKVDAATGDTVIAVVNLDPYRAQEGTLHLDLPALGRDVEEPLAVCDEVSGAEWVWSAHNYVRLVPEIAVAHIVAVRTRRTAATVPALDTRPPGE